MPPIPKLVNRGAAGLLTKVETVGNLPQTPTIKQVRDKIAKALEGLVVPIGRLKFDPLNARMHPEKNMQAIKDSLCLYGQVKPVVVRKQTGIVMAGNGTLQAATELGWTKIAAAFVPMSDLDAAGYGVADNRTAEHATWNLEVLSRILRLQNEAGVGIVGWSPEEINAALQMGLAPIEPEPTLNLSDRFVIPPFSVLDARQGYWQNRKRAWLSLGIKSELGRGDAATWGIAPSGEGTGENSDANYTDNAKRKNGLLGESEQARSHYKANATPGGSMPPTRRGPDGKLTRVDLHMKTGKANATPGGSPLPAARLGKDGKTVRGDGKGRPLARTFGSGNPGDLATGFKAGKAIPGGGTGKNTCYPGSKSQPLDPESRYAKQSSSGLGGELAYGVNDWVRETVPDQTSLSAGQSGTSIFDPVLCELAYRWFSPPKGHVLDPFAGGSVRGIVAAKLGRRYTGIDLRPEQAAANVEQGNRITPDNKPKWVVGDSVDAGKIAKGQYDFVFSCPPYADLERYSDDPRDLSTMDYDGFLEIYHRIIAESCRMLKDNRFACFVVGDIRDRKTGNYRGFPADTAAAFAAAGLELYNEAILVTAVGSLPIRVGKQFASGRKLGKTHQNVLVFVKGDPSKATKDCGTVETATVEEMQELFGFSEVSDETT